MTLMTLTYEFFQHYWWIIISVLGATLVFLMFVQGGQTLFFSLGKDDNERMLMINSLGRKWEFTFTTLVTFGGAFFAAFPLFYATSFGGGYWIWMLILFSFIFQAIAYHYRTKPANIYGTRFYEIALLVNGIMGPLLLGAVVGTFYNGAPFLVSEINTSSWANQYHGLGALANVHNLSLGLAVLFLARVLGILYFMNDINHEEIIKRAQKHLIYNTIPFLVFFLFFLVKLMFIDGFAIGETGEIRMVPFKYWQNLLDMPFVMGLLLAGIVLVLGGIAISGIKKSPKGIWYAGPGVILVVMMLLLLAGFNQTSFYPSTHDLQSSLTIYNASSSFFTLKTMAIASLMIPFVFAYIFYTWRAINKKQISMDEFENGGEHKY